MSKWQPLLTAPRDGTHILFYFQGEVYTALYEEHVGFWHIASPCDSCWYNIHDPDPQGALWQPIDYPKVEKEAGSGVAYPRDFRPVEGGMVTDAESGRLRLFVLSTDEYPRIRVAAQTQSPERSVERLTDISNLRPLVDALRVEPASLAGSFKPVVGEIATDVQSLHRYIVLSTDNYPEVRVAIQTPGCVGVEHTTHIQNLRQVFPPTAGQTV